MLTLRSKNASWCHNVFTKFFTNNLIWCLFDRSRVLTIHTLAYAHRPDLSVRKIFKTKTSSRAELSWAEYFSVSTVSAGVGTWTVWKQQLSYNADNVWGALNQAAAYCCTPLHALALLLLLYRLASYRAIRSNDNDAQWMKLILTFFI